MLDIQQGFVDKRHEILKSDFYKNYVHTSVPVILTGLTQNWSLEGKWTPTQLVEILGDRSVRATYSDGNYDFSRGSDNWVERSFDRQVTFRQAVNDIESGVNDDQRVYLHQRSIPDKFPELLSHLKVPELIDEKDLHSLNLWFGSGGNVSGLHYDQPNNFLFQLYGRKRLIIYPPEELSKLYPSANIPHFSQVDPGRPDLDNFPLLAQARGYEVTLEEGEALFIPAFWWHQVYSETNSISVNMFWKAYVHQILVPAMFMALPTIYPQLNLAYHQYHQGELTSLIDYAEYAAQANHAGVGAVFACASLKLALARLVGGGLSSNDVLPTFEQADQLNAKCLEQEYYSTERGQQIKRWLTQGRQALEGVAQGSSSDGAQSMIRDVKTFVNTVEQASRVH